MVAESFLIAILEKVGDKVFEELWGAAYGKFKDQFKADVVRKAVIRATSFAIKDYELSSDSDSKLTLILRSSDEFLSTDLVLGEFQKLYAFHVKPDSYAVACWLFETVVPDMEQQDQVSRFIELLNARMRAEKELLPWFQANDLLRVAEAVERLALHVPELSRFHIDYGQFILDKSRNFVGREWLFSQIADFLKDPKHKSGYIMIIGDPGMGKSALMAKLASDNAWPHHFNQRREGKNKPRDFIQNICTQLIAAYQLDPAAYLPFDISSSVTLESILRDLSNRADQCPIVLLVDALDEIEGKELEGGANPLYLPRTLPDRVFIVASVRDDRRYFPAVNADLVKLPIKRAGSEHQRDIHEYLTAVVGEDSVRSYLREMQISEEEFISYIARKSEYNFMYLSLVIPELTRSDGVYHRQTISQLPEGLKGYYLDHWDIMKSRSREDWFRLTLPVLVALSLEHLPISVERISKLIPPYYEIIGENSEPPSKVRIRSILNELSAFVHSEETAGAEHFRLYHESFYDFICKQNDVSEERIELMRMHEALTNQLKDEFDLMD